MRRTIRCKRPVRRAAACGHRRSGGHRRRRPTSGWRTALHSPNPRLRNRVHSAGMVNGAMITSIGPLGEERALHDAPVTVQPCPHQLGRAGGFELLHVVVAQKSVVGDFGRDEDALQSGLGIGEDLAALWGRVDVAAAHPMVAWAAWVSGCAESDRHADAAAERGHQFEDRFVVGEIADLLDVDAGVGVALVEVGVGVALEEGEAQASAVACAATSPWSR